MRSKIYSGEVSHARLIPVNHSFCYPVYFYAFDLGELAELTEQIPLFGYNRVRPVAIHDKDYLLPGDLPIRTKLDKVLRAAGITATVQKTILITSARFFNYVFNPISFFYCYDRSEQLVCILAQVNNTFGEMHLYPLDLQNAARVDGRLQFMTDKRFHVSPFFSRDGHYQFLLTEPGNELDNQIHYYRDEQLALVARIHGRATPLTSSSLLRNLLRHPVSASLTMPRICWQAAKLYWRRRLPVHDKPVPDSAMTVRPVPPGIIDRIGLILCFKFFARLPDGELRLTLPDGSQYRFGQPDAEPSLTLAVKEYRFFRRAMLSGDIGFGEAYVEGDWSSPDLPGLLTHLAANESVMDDRSVLTSTTGRWINYLRHLLRHNTIKGSSRNIREHYDLNNDFFAMFLDPSMTYSSAIFNRETDSLQQAQQNKLQTIIDKAGLTADDHVLEIGCGWGSFALEAVRQIGCRVTGITLSHEQLELAQQRVKAAGLEDQVTLKLCDYRQVTGCYSRIVSIEMLEAVGHAGIRPFFAICDQVLIPGGKALIQVITIPDRKYRAYRYSSDWIRKHIFPGGHLPSVEVLEKAITSSSRLSINTMEHFGLDYSRTLDCWRKALLTRHQEVQALGFDEKFLRKWEYYFAYCQAGFAAGIIDLTQLLLQKPTPS